MGRIGQNFALANFDPKTKPPPPTDLRDIHPPCLRRVCRPGQTPTTKFGQNGETRLAESSGRH
eukprot:6357443-Lingulodinium_polyedra.AAC.1